MRRKPMCELNQTLTSSNLVGQISKVLLPFAIEKRQYEIEKKNSRQTII